MKNVVTVFFCVLALEAWAGFGMVPESDSLFPNGKVPYVVAPDCPVDEGLIRAALDDFSRKTGGVIQFVALQAFHLDGVRFTGLEKDDGANWQTVGSVHGWELGRMPGVRPIMLSRHADAVTIQHEVMHKLGFRHEMNRPDSRNHITVDDFGFTKQMKRQFEPEETEFVAESFEKITNKTRFVYYTPYDLNSVMQYGSSAVGNALTTREGYLIPGPRGLSASDIASIKKMYENAKTKHGSYYQHFEGTFSLVQEEEKAPKGIFSFGGSPETHRVITMENGVKHALMVSSLPEVENEKNLVKLEVWTNCATFWDPLVGGAKDGLRLRTDYLRLHLKDGTTRDYRMIRHGYDREQHEELVLVQ